MLRTGVLPPTLFNLRRPLLLLLSTHIHSCQKLGKMGAGRKSASCSENKEGVKRGTLMVMEGCDRTGKTTQAKQLVEFLNSAGKHTVFMRFPERSTHIGGIIDKYLSNKQELDDRAIHLLFSANRWELLPEIQKVLKSGTNIIIDRYAYSGVAFSAAKPGMSLEWCKGSDAGLPRPDLVLFLDLTPEQALSRGGYGTERYESQKFQERVRENYHSLKDNSWKVIDADRTIEKLQEVLRTEVLNAVNSVKQEELPILW
ncbi:hypothetical protein Pcinc_026558 [Petrolisthes cinctipes]|uniref:Thymidylate kinase n=1 Tax=Petrolisthes cinctipes TaxID=88211 RepID=A0AAE1KA44_PETCI|nr:hypothetical protein Pcinc_026558 [Petrolisthes cinctipes]